MTYEPEHPQLPTDATHAERDPQLDAELDALLADEAIASRQTPEQLEAKVLALTDPRLLSLLDEALAPEQVPAQLADRIVAATMPGALASVGTPHRAVLARIEPSTWRYAAAAAIVLAAGAGLWWLGQQTQTHDRIAEEDAFDSSTLSDLFNRGRTTS